MNSRRKVVETLSLVFLFIPLLYLAYLYPTWPKMAHTPFITNGDVEVFVNKQTVLLVSLLIGFGVYGALTLLNSKTFGFKRPESQRVLMDKIKVCMCFIMCFAGMYTFSTIDQGGKNEWLTGQQAVIITFSLFHIFIGNYMYSNNNNEVLNYLSPASLTTDHQKKKSNRFTSVVWVITGLINLIVAICVSYPILIWCAINVLGSVASVSYRFILKRRLENR